MYHINDIMSDINDLNTTLTKLDIATQTCGLNRDITDKFYTKNNIVMLCSKFIKKYINITTTDLIIEPSAGNGAFIDIIKNMSTNHLFYDLFPEHDEINKQDYLDLDINNFCNSKNNIHTIGNPPFGRQSSLAIKFIKQSCKFSNSISFILPKSFKKDSLKKHFPANFHLIFQYDLPEYSFIVNNIDTNVPCIFQIWIKKINNRIIPLKLEPINFSFVKKNEEPDFSFRRVGVYAGKIDTFIDTQSIQSHYFIKLKKFNNNIINKLSQIQFNCDNTVGPNSISKQELIIEFNNIL